MIMGMNIDAGVLGKVFKGIEWGLEDQKSEEETRG